MKAIVTGLPYPSTLLQVAIRRIRAEQAKRDARTGKLVQNVTHARSALIKACLNRQQRLVGTTEKEVTVSLDYANTNSGYRWGVSLLCWRKSRKKQIQASIPRFVNASTVQLRARR